MRLVLELGLEHLLGVGADGDGHVVVDDCVHDVCVVSVDAGELFCLESLISGRFWKEQL